MEPQAAGRRILMCRIAGDEDVAVTIMLGHALAPLPIHHRENLEPDIGAGEAAQIGGAVIAGHGFQHREPPQFLAVDADDFTPGAAGISETEEPRPALTVNLHELGRAEEHIDAVGDETLALIVEAERGHDRSVGAVAADEIARGELLAAAG